MQEQVSALQKPYPGAPVVISEGVPVGFNFGRNQANSLGSLVGISTAENVKVSATIGFPPTVADLQRIRRILDGTMKGLAWGRKMMDGGVNKYILQKERSFAE